ncbi:lectin-like domain-containing protein [Pontibacter russatus]|uniref:lectin-like domain-containing protein n=1 Tax=Pontibacter russatus TaxID=2694929 RepID=UPI001379EF69|nr:gliding motility-associated C-terminal domain-containing protein [Pontibacter russatus]
MNAPLPPKAKFPAFTRTILTAIWGCLLVALFTPLATQAQFVTRGDAVKLSEQCYKITEDRMNRYGSIWSEKKLDLSKPVELEFIIYMGTKDREGADGIAFLMHNDPRGLTATGAIGGGLGYGDPSGIRPSVAMEFDTWHNMDDPADIAADHTALVYNGNIRQPVVRAMPIDPNSPDIENNQCHTYKIAWDPETQLLQLYFDGELRISHTDDIIKNVFRGTKEVYYGFTGSTGGSSNEQTICVLGEAGVPVANDDMVEAAPGKPIEVAVLANDTHTGGAALTLTRIVSQTGKGVAEIVGDKIIYTPDAWVAEADNVVTYEVSDAGSGQCYAKTATAKLHIRVRCQLPLDPVEITVEGAITFCEGESVRLSVPGLAGPVYTWKRNGIPVGENNPELVASVSGNYTIEVSTVCGTVTADAVAVKANPTPAPPIVPDVERCGPGTITLKATGGNESEYRWYTAASGAPPLEDATGSRYITPELTATATYYVSVVRDGCESSRVPVRAVVETVPELAPFAEVIVDEGESVEIQSAPGGASYIWTPASGLSNTTVANPVAQPAQTTTYTVTVTTAGGCRVTGQVKVIMRKELVIPNAFSPNGDGVNETWEIATLEGYPDARVEVFDRWGSRLFERTGYIREWNGTLHGKALPQSTYFYVITLSGGRKLTGSVSIVH